MKHVSWIVAALVGFALGFFARGAAFAPAPRVVAAPPAPGGAQQQRPVRPVEDPRAVYRVALEDSPVRGPADALVTIVESSDFECPFCKRAAPTLKQVEEAYAGKVRVAFKHNPLGFHPNALPAALAAEEGRAQGGDAKFWAMHDQLFQSATLDQASLERAAGAAGLDLARFREALQTRKHEARIRRDQTLVVGLGATGTPTFFVNGRKLVGAQPFEAFKAVVDEELAKAEAAVKAGTPARDLYARIMEKAATAPVNLPGAAQPSAQPAQPPQPPATIYRKVDVRPDDPARGPADAKLTVVVFSDFQCPFCGRVEPSLRQLEEALGGQIRVTWKHQPLSFHPNALPAALAAEAAREQGKFWQMHGRLFSNQQDLSPATYERYARELGLDLGKFKAAQEGAKAKARIAEDQALAGQVGAMGTPTMFFNCRQVVGALPVERLRAIADEELAKVKALSFASCISSCRN